jgi:hypoxanthine phosphoribosyltransferase
MAQRLKECFVMMPSGRHDEYRDGEKEAEFTFNGIIVPAVQEAFPGMPCLRELDYQLPGAITNSIIEHIAQAELCIIDLTGQNPNVFLELGIRWSLSEKRTVLIHQKGTVLPFDISNYKSLEYSTTLDGPAQAVDQLTEVLKSVSRGDRRYDSLVYDALEALHVEFKVKSRSVDPGAPPMPWDIYWDKVQTIKKGLRSKFSDGLYIPTVVLGITNGGAMLADLLVREVYTDTPIAVLWANRQHREHSYFDNPLNHGIVDAIKNLERGAQLNILLVDDIVASGNTYHKALEFLNQHIPNADVQFLPLFSRDERYHALVREHILWHHPAFGMSDQEAQQMHNTKWTKLPYDKDIRPAS